VIFPSSIGGGNWNPPSFDPTLGYLFVNTMDFGSLNTMVKSADGSRYSRSGYNGINRFWEPESNMPCNQPPWGRLFAINVNTGRYRVANHSRNHRESSGLTSKKPAGRILAGSLATAGGLCLSVQRMTADFVHSIQRLARNYG
jgi:quinoprotein glucose dehydrogenase